MYLTLLLGIVLSLLTACASISSNVDENFGLAVRQTIATQTVNPVSSKESNSIAPTDGQSAKATIDRYQKSFEVVPATNSVLSIGAGGNSPSR